MDSGEREHFLNSEHEKGNGEMKSSGSDEGRSKVRRVITVKMEIG